MPRADVMDRIERLAARLRRGAKEPRQPLLSEEMDTEYAGLVADIVRKIDNHWDIAGFVIAVLDESGMPSEAQAVSQLLSDSERVQAAKKLVEGTPYGERPTACTRCGSELRKGYCIDETCPFSDRLQSDPEGWHGHPGRSEQRGRGMVSGSGGIGASVTKKLRRPGGRTGQMDPGPLPGTVRRDSMPWYCHDCGTSKRHPLSEGCPACVSCGKSMVSDSHLKDRDGPIRGGGPPRHLKDRR
jgi:hypothetical protein